MIGAARRLYVPGAILLIASGTLSHRAVAQATAQAAAQTAAQAVSPPTTSVTQAWVDVGGAEVRQPMSRVTRMTGSAGGGVWHQRGTIALIGEGAMSFAADSLAAAQLLFRTVWAPRTSLGWFGTTRTDVDLAVTSVGLVMPGRSGTRTAAVQQTLQRGPLSLSAQTGIGATSRYGDAFLGTTVGATLGLRVRGLDARVQGVRASTDDWQLMEAANFFLARQASGYVVDDRTASLAWRGTVFGVTLGASAAHTARRARYPTIGETDGEAYALSWQATSSLLLIAQTGMQLGDVLRGVPQARYAGASVRWIPTGLRRGVRGNANNATSIPVVAAGEVRLERGSAGGTLELTIDAPANATVEVASSHTEWAPVSMTRDGTRFVHRLTLPQGTHRVAVRINGGAWRAPRGLAAVDDGYGGTAGVVIVP